MTFPQVRRWSNGLLVLLLSLLSLLPSAQAASAPRQDPTATFTRISSVDGDFPVPGSGGKLTASQVFDVDQDGDLDFVLGLRDDSQGSVIWYRRDNNGWTRLVIEDEGMPIEAGGAFHDIDGDGDQDLVLGGDWRSNDVWWWENPRPNYGQSWTRRLIKDSDANQHHDMAFGDVDGDGATELIFWNQGSNKLYLADIPANPRTSGLWPLQAIYTWSSGPIREGLEIADIDGDGKADIVGGGSWFKHTGGANYSERIIDRTQGQARVVTGQLVPGGYPEVVMVLGDANGPLKWYQWNGASWVPNTLVNVVDNGHSLQIVDLNQDGHLDIFNAEMRLDAGSNARMWIFYGNGAGSFTQELLATGYDNHESRVADLDNDGNLDILTKPFDWQAPRLDIWLNNAAPRLCTPSLDKWQRHVVDNNQRWRAVFVDSADINRDGQIDIVSGGDWYQNPGSAAGNWQRRAIGDPVNNMAAIYDFDNDGDPDILGTAGSSSVYSNAFHWAENNGSGGFTVRSNVEAGDGDFLQGVAVASYQGATQVALSWHEANKGIQMLTVPNNPRTQTWSRSLASSVSQDEQLTAGDIDRDGDIDLMLGTKWLRNNSSQTPNWHDGARRYRVTIAVDAAGFSRNEHPAEVALNFTPLLAGLSGAAFAPNSLHVVEVNQNDTLVNADTPFQFDPAAGFDVNSNASGTLTLLMTGATSANATRRYHVYFETIDGTYTPVTPTDRVVVSSGNDEEQSTFQVATSNSTYHYQQLAAGFSSLVDLDGNDWISFSNATGSAGAFRGIPNLVYPEGYFHPGDDNATSTLRHDGPLKATIESSSNDGAWQATWEIFPSFARMTVNKSGHDYWFLYEGTPGGALEPATDVVVRADGGVTDAGFAWTGDLEPEEWAYFADPNVGSSGRALFVAQNQNDAIVDSYYALNGEMTVFGFGRNGVTSSLNSTPRQFTIGLLETTTYADAGPIIRSAYRPISATVGQAEARGATGGSWEALTLNNTPGLPDRNRLVDLNGDGRLDVVIGYEPQSGATERLAWYRQPANVTSQWPETVIATLTRPMSMDARDMDGDGDVDVIVGEHDPSNPSGLRLLIFENQNGTGTAWTQHLVYTGDEHHDGTHVVDIDQDGDFDIVSIGWINDKVVLYENLSDCADDATPPPPTATPGPQPTSTPVDPPTATATATPPPGGSGPCEAAPSNVVRNPGFEAGTAEWFFYTNGSAAYSTTTNQPAQCSRAAQVAVSRGGSNVQLSQSGIRLEAGVRYRLTFAARASTNRTIGLYLHKDSAPYGSFGFGQSIALSPSWQRFSFEFTASGFSGVTTDARLRAWLVSVNPGESVYFDDFVIERADTPPPVPTATPTPPNPTSTPDGPNQRPIADAGPDVTVTDADGSGSEIVALSGARSSDPDGQIAQYRWRSDTGVAIANQMESSGDFPVGVHTVDLIVIDDDGASKRDTIIVTVNPADTPPPTDTPTETPTEAPTEAPTETPDGSGPCEAAPSNVVRNPGFEAGTG